MMDGHGRKKLYPARVEDVGYGQVFEIPPSNRNNEITAQPPALLCESLTTPHRLDRTLSASNEPTRISPQF